MDIEHLTPLIDRYGYPTLMSLVQFLFTWMLLRQNSSAFDFLRQNALEWAAAQRENAAATRQNTESNRALSGQVARLAGCEASKYFRDPPVATGPIKETK